MLRASVAYTGSGALAGLAVLLTGAVFLVLARSKQRNLAVSMGDHGKE